MTTMQCRSQTGDCVCGLSQVCPSSQLRLWLRHKYICRCFCRRRIMTQQTAATSTRWWRGHFIISTTTSRQRIPVVCWDTCSKCKLRRDGRGRWGVVQYTTLCRRHRKMLNASWTNLNPPSLCSPISSAAAAGSLSRVSYLISYLVLTILLQNREQFWVSSSPPPQSVINSTFLLGPGISYH